MDLSELKVKDAELAYPEVEAEEDEEETEEDDTEVDLQNALLLLRDAGDLLGTLASKTRRTWPDVINVYVGNQIEKLGCEITAFINDFDLDDPPGNAA